MHRFKDPEQINRRLRKIRSAVEGEGRKAKEAARRLRLMPPCKEICCGRKSRNQCKRCPRRLAEILFTPLKVKVPKAHFQTLS